MRQLLVFGVPFLVATLLFGCESSPTEVFELSGEITDERTTEPIEGARVSFRSDTGYTAETTSDSNGIYRMAIETDHPFGQVIAEAAGYVPNQQTVYFDARDRRIDIQLRPDGSM